MSSKRRVRRRTCKRKKKYEAVEAQAAAKAQRGHTAYKCRFCSGWHTGHTPRRVRQSMKARKNNAT